MGLPWWPSWLRICLRCRRPQFGSWFGKICWRRDRLPIWLFLGFPGGSDGKESACHVGDLGSVPGLRRSPGGEHGNPLQYSGQENSMDYLFHGVAKSWTWLSGLIFIRFYVIICWWTFRLFSIFYLLWMMLLLSSCTHNLFESLANFFGYTHRIRVSGYFFVHHFQGSIRLLSMQLYYILYSH